MAVTYPIIPIPLVSGYSHNDSIKTKTIAVVTGSPRFELITTESPVLFKVNWFFTDKQMQIFDGWFRHDLKFGSLSFDLNLKVGGGLKSHEVYFNGKTYSSTLVGKRWKVSANLIGISKQYDDLATYQTARDSIIPPGEIGDFYFKLDEPATSFMNTYFSTTVGQLNTDISLQIGDSVKFSYFANNSNPLTSENFIESSDGVNFFGYDSSLNVGDCLFVGYTATLDNVPINNGDNIPFNIPSKYPVGGARLDHTVVLTATTATDIRFIGTAGIEMAIFDVTITTTGQTWIYPIDSLTLTNADSNGSGNNLVLSLNNFIVDYPVMLNSGYDINNIAPYFYVDNIYFDQSSNNINYNVASIRSDGARGAMDTAGSTHWFGSGLVNIPIAYKNGFAIEVIVKYNSSVNSSGSACGVISATSNSFTDSLWAIGFDNYDDLGSVKPHFSILRNALYHNSSSYSSLLADIRGDAVVVGEVYHLIGSISPLNKTINFFVNGISQGVVNLSSTDMDTWLFGTGVEFGLEDVKNGIFKTRFDIGARLTNGAWRSGQHCHIQDLRVHLKEIDNNFAMSQYNSNKGA